MVGQLTFKWVMFLVIVLWVWRLSQNKKVKKIKKEGEINEFYFLQSIFGLTKWKKEWIEGFWKIKALGLTY